MEKTNITLLPEPQLLIETVRQVKLEEFWNRLPLSGGFWRLYHHDTPGAGVIQNGRKIELLPDALYLLPPYAELTSWQSGNPVQLFIHFEAASLFGNPEYRVNRVELAADLPAMVTEIRQLLNTQTDSTRIGILALALSAAALARLPSAALCELDRDHRITQICNWIRNHPDRELDIATLASRAGFAPNAFIRRFREVTGSTPHQYLLNLRYTLAARLLESTDLAIDAVCTEIGVSDRFHFSRTFKRFYGAPPAAYRELARRKH